jgi:hypothetical protein
MATTSRRLVSAYYDVHGRQLAKFGVPVSPGNQTLSFLGVRFQHARVARVRITSGSAVPGQNARLCQDIRRLMPRMHKTPIGHVPSHGARTSGALVATLADQDTHLELDAGDMASTSSAFALRQGLLRRDLRR